MTNERLEYFCRNVDVSNAKWPIQNEVAVVDIYEAGKLEYEDFIVLFDNGVRVGAILPMGKYDLHMLTLPEHRGKGYMSKFFRTGIIKLLQPTLVRATTDFLRLDENEFYKQIIADTEGEDVAPADIEYKRMLEAEAEERKKIEHIMSLAGIAVVDSINNAFGANGLGKFTVPVFCPYCGNQTKVSWDCYFSYAQYVKATDTIIYTVDCNRYDCYHCNEEYRVSGGIIENNAGKCFFNTVKASK